MEPSLNLEFVSTIARVVRKPQNADGIKKAALGMQRNVPLYEQIHEVLWEKLIEGEIHAHDRLRDSVWAKQLGVSRTPVREALRKMEQDGILDLLPFGGYEVRRLSGEDAAGLVECCAVLEGVAAREIARVADEEKLVPLRALAAEGRVAARHAEHAHVIERDRAFRLAIVRACGVHYLEGLYVPIRRLLRVCENDAMRAMASRDVDRMLRRRSVRIGIVHRNLLKAIELRDQRTARRTLEAHVRDEAHSWALN